MVEAKKKKKKNLFLNSVHTRPVQGNYGKKSKKIQEIKKTLFAIIFNQNGDNIGRERFKKILDTNSVHTRRGQENSKKNRKF